jgi:hypothetical protein
MISQKRYWLKQNKSYMLEAIEEIENTFQMGRS